MNEKNEPTCGDCKFCVEVRPDTYECHRRAAQIYSGTANDGYDSADYIGKFSGWPNVDADDWCGEYETATPAQKKGDEA